MNSNLVCVQRIKEVCYDLQWILLSAFILKRFKIQPLQKAQCKFPQSSWIPHDPPILFQFHYGDISGILIHNFDSKHHNKGIWIHPLITDFRNFSCRRCIKPDRLHLAAKWVFLKSSAVSRVPLWKNVTTVIRCLVKFYPCWIFYRRRPPWALGSSPFFG